MVHTVYIKGRTIRYLRMGLRKHQKKSSTALSLKKVLCKTKRQTIKLCHRMAEKKSCSALRRKKYLTNTDFRYFCVIIIFNDYNLIFYGV